MAICPFEIWEWVCLFHKKNVDYKMSNCLKGNKWNKELVHMYLFHEEEKKPK